MKEKYNSIKQLMEKTMIICSFWKTLMGIFSMLGTHLISTNLVISFTSEESNQSVNLYNWLLQKPETYCDSPIKSMKN